MTNFVSQKEEEKSFLDYLGGKEFVGLFILGFILSLLVLDLSFPIEISKSENMLGLKINEKNYQGILDQSPKISAFNMFLIFCYALLKWGVLEMWFRVKGRERFEKVKELEKALDKREQELDKREEKLTKRERQNGTRYHAL